MRRLFFFVSILLCFGAVSKGLAQVAGNACSPNGITAGPDRNGNNLICNNAIWSISATSGGQNKLTWVVFSVNANGGNSTPVIINQNNVASVVRNAQADWTINFTNALSSNNYAWSGSITNDNNNQNAYLSGPINIPANTSRTASSLRVWGNYQNNYRNADTETAVVSVIIIGP